MRIYLRDDIVLAIKYRSLISRFYYNIIIISTYLRIISYKKSLLINIIIVF